MWGQISLCLPSWISSLVSGTYYEKKCGDIDKNSLSRAQNIVFNNQVSFEKPAITISSILGIITLKKTWKDSLSV